MKKALIIAFHFPPLKGSSGIQRTLSLVRFLPRNGWQPLVLTADPGAYAATSPDQLADIPPDTIVRRAWAVDAARSLSIRGRYPGILALPDRWISWSLGGLMAGLAMIRRYKPDVIWSTYPIATAHLIGFSLHRLTGVPWIADFRDPMVEQIGSELYPADKRVRRARLLVERKVADGAAAVTFCTASALSIFLQRYSGFAKDKGTVVANGFDEETFEKVEAAVATQKAVPRTGFHLLHSGTLYPGSDRDPGYFLSAVAALRKKGLVPAHLLVTLRASGFDEEYRQAINVLGLQETVTLAPAIGYTEALREMMTADGLLLFQGSHSNPAIPAKLYEYLRAYRPIFAMVDGAGETAALLRRLGIGKIVRFDSTEAISAALAEFISEAAERRQPVLERNTCLGYSRERRVAELANVFDEVLTR